MFPLTFNKQSGFSLLEVLIAVLILAFLMLGVTVTVNQSIDSKDLVVGEDRDYLQVQMALARVEADLSQIYTPLLFSPRYDPKFDPYNYGKNKVDAKIYNPNKYYVRNPRFSYATQNLLPVPKFANPERSALEVFTSANRRKVEGVEQSHFSWVRYYLRAMESPDENFPQDKEYSSLMRENWAGNPFTDSEDFEAVRSSVILDHVTSLRFSFWNPERNEFVDRLNEVKNGEFFIHAVKIELSYMNHQGLEREVEKTILSRWPKFVPETMEDQSKVAPNNPTNEDFLP